MIHTLTTLDKTTKTMTSMTTAIITTTNIGTSAATTFQAIDRQQH